MKLNEQIAAHRKKLGWTQEELAGKLGVTGQSVSKWESGICCPDIALLPTLADLFDVDLDTLMGRERPPQPPRDFREIAWQLRRYFTEAEPDTHFRDTFRLAVILHEILSTDGYRKPVPWDADASFEKTITDAAPRKWGTSISSLPAGSTVYSGSGIFFGCGSTWTSPAPADLHRLASSLRRLANTDVLFVLFGIYSLTHTDFDRYVTAEEIAAAAEIPPERTREILDTLPLTIARQPNGSFTYRLDGAYMHLPLLLSLGSCHDMPCIAFR